MKENEEYIEMDEILNVPAAIALRQRPGVPGVRSTFAPYENLTIDQGAVAPWNSLMWSLMTDVCRAYVPAVKTVGTPRRIKADKNSITGKFL